MSEKENKAPAAPKASGVLVGAKLDVSKLNAEERGWILRAAANIESIAQKAKDAEAAAHRAAAQKHETREERNKRKAALQK
jgi:hypothetical protein